ncbi:hypothetical protein BD311DRAFT_743816, partial [Dichomitus squalens]
LINPTTDLGANHHVVVPKKTDNPGGFNLQANHNLGDHKAVGSWIFHVTPPGGEDEQEEWEQEAQRVQWFRSRANLARTNEEVNLVYAEARALRRGFLFASDEWLRRDSALPDYASPGATAYAREKSDMFKIMSEECRRLVQTAHDKHYAAMAQDETRQDAFEVTQKQIHLSDDRLNYSLVSETLVPW